MRTLPVMLVEVTEFLDLGVVDGGVDLGPVLRCPDMLEVVPEVLLADRAVRILLVGLREELG